MKYSDLLDNASVLILEENSVRRELFDEWISDVSTKMAAGPEELFQQFDSSVTVACLSQSSLGDDEAKIRKFILFRNPSCQLVLVTSSPFEGALSEDNYDAVITRPISRGTLQSVIQKRLRYGIYSTLVEDFYALNTKLISLERSDSREVDDTRDKIKKQIDQLMVPINHLKSTIDREDAEQLLKSVSLHRRYLNTSTEVTERSSVSKYHPEKCPSCSLVWGVDHGNKLGLGFTQIGAGVWKCTKCDHLIENANGDNRYVP